MSGPLDGLRTAFTYFSTLPVGDPPGGGGPPGPEALEALPAVGLVTGLLAGLAGRLAAGRLPAALVPPLVVAVRLGLTGAVHLDGYLDGCDAYFASATPERRLEILKDPRHGTYALAGFAVWLPFELAALGAIPARRLPLALAATGLLSRLAAVANARGAASGPAAASPAFARPPGLVPLAVAGLAGLALGARAARGGWMLPFVAVPAGLALGRFARRQSGGRLTGDGYGWTVVVVEGLLLTCVAGSSSRR